MKNTKIFRLIFKIAISLLLACTFFISIIFVYEGNKYNDYIIKSNGNNRIKEIWINGTKQKLETFQANKVLYDSSKDILLLKNNSIINKSLSKIYEFNIIFEKNKEVGTVIIKINNFIQKYDLKSEKNENICIEINDSSNIKIIKKYMKNDLKMNHVMLFLLSTVVYYFLINVIIKFIYKVKYNKVKFLDILKYYGSIFLIFLTTFYIFLEKAHLWFLIFICFGIFTGLIYIKDGIKNNWNNLFIYLMIPISLTFCFTMIPDNVPDENSHFYKSYILSTNSLGKKIDENNDYCIKSNKEINAKLSEFNFNVLDSNFTINTKAYYGLMRSINHLNYYDKEDCYRNISKLPYVAYSITTLSIIVSKILNLPIIIAYMFGRALNLLFYLIIVYYSIKIIPKYKKSIFIVATLPIAIQQAGAYNQDCVHNAMFIYLFSLLISAINKKTLMTLKEKIEIIISSIILAFCKMGYFPLIILATLIPKERFNNKKNSIINKVIIIMPIVVIFAVLYFKSWNTVSSIKAIGERYSIANLFSNPIDFIRLYLSTIYKFGFYMLFQGLVDGFGWSTRYNSTLSTTLLAISYGIMILTGNKDKKNNKKYTILTMICSFIICGLIMTSMLGHNYIGSSYISGLQPRYFIPVILLLLSCFNIKILNLNNKNENYVVGIIIIIIYIAVLMTIGGFYV